MENMVYCESSVCQNAGDYARIDGNFPMEKASGIIWVARSGTDEKREEILF